MTINSTWLKDNFILFNLLSDDEIARLMTQVVKASRLTSLSVEQILVLLDQDVQKKFPRA